MILRNMLTGRVHGADLVVDHAAGSYGQPVVVLRDEGSALDPVGWEVVHATDEERGSLPFTWRPMGAE